MPKQLWDTTMNPQTRMMKRVEIEDALEADRIFNILMGDKVCLLYTSPSPRDGFTSRMPSSA